MSLTADFVLNDALSKFGSLNTFLIALSCTKCEVGVSCMCRVQWVLDISNISVEFHEELEF